MIHQMAVVMKQTHGIYASVDTAASYDTDGIQEATSDEIQ